MNDLATVGYFHDFVRRLRLALGWVAVQFWALPLLLLAGLAWTRLPDKHAWQVLLSLLIPLLLAAAFLILETGLLRRLLDQQERRTRFVTGALMLLVWAAIVWAAWAILDWCNDQIPQWAGYLNSRAPAHMRAHLFTYEHIQAGLTLLVWIWRWIVLPAKIIPHAMASPQWGWRLPWPRLIRFLFNWRWWLAVIAAALAGAALPGHFFAAEPHGTVHHQVWAVLLKLIGSYLLAVVSWVLLLTWCAVLLTRQPEPAKGALDRDLLDRLCKGRLWIAATTGWVLLSAFVDYAMARLPSNLRAQNWTFLPVAVVMFALRVVVQTGLLRAMIDDEGKRVRFIWGALSMLVWVVPVLAVAGLGAVFHAPDSLLWAFFLVLSAILIPFSAASTQRALRLPWRRIMQVLYNWRWWIGVLFAAIIGAALANLFEPSASTAAGSLPEEIPVLRTILADVLSFGSWVVLMGWVTVLLARAESSPKRSGNDVLHVAPANSDLPLPESSEGGSGNA